MSLEMSSDKAVCHRCGTVYSRRKGYFPVSYSVLNKGTGHTHICRNCIDNIYDGYLSQCNDPKLAVRQVCRKLDLFWSEKVFDIVNKQSVPRSMMTQYLSKIASTTYAGKSYDDTLSLEGTLWNFGQNTTDAIVEEKPEEKPVETPTQDGDESVSDDIVMFWGSGYTPNMYRELEQRKAYWVKRLGEDYEMDIGTEAIIRQICALELDINRDRAAGKAIDKNVNALNNLLGSAKLKPNQKNDDIDTDTINSPLGVWIYRYEYQKPLPDVDDDLKDVNKLRKYVFTWLGHLCKMLNIKNAYSDLYESEISKYTVDKPEYDGDDDIMKDNEETIL